MDYDLAILYEVETKVLNQAVKRNSIRFPDDFMFQITLDEFESNWSQIVTSSIKHRGKVYLPYAFTEQGVAMLSSVLRSEKAALVNIAIMRAFITIRKTISLQSHLSKQIMELIPNTSVIKSNRFGVMPQYISFSSIFIGLF